MLQLIPNCHHAPNNGVSHNVVYIRWKSIYVTPEVDHEYLVQLRLNSGPESLVGQFTRVNEKCLSTLQQHSSAGLVVICRPWSFVFCFNLFGHKSLQITTSTEVHFILNEF